MTMTWKRINEQLGVGEEYSLCVRLITLCTTKYSNILGGAPESSDFRYIASDIRVGSPHFCTLVCTESLIYFMYVTFRIYSIFMTLR